MSESGLPRRRIFPPGVPLRPLQPNPEFGDARLPARFWSKAYVNSEGCWIWIGHLNAGRGYGVATWRKRQYKAHRVTYIALVGAIPLGRYIDHLCRVRACCNPAHLEVVSGRENALRGTGPTAINAQKTHCPRGHAYEGNNVIWATEKGKVSGRKCRTCERKRLAAISKVRRAAEKEARRAAKAVSL